MGTAGSKDMVIFPDATFVNHTAAVSCIDSSMDQTIIATGSDDFYIRTWFTKEDVDECAGLLRGHQSYITYLVIHGDKVISGDASGSLRRWDLATSECEFIYKGHSTTIMRITCTGSYIFTSSIDKTAKVWRINETDEDNGCIRTFNGHQKSVIPLIYLAGPDDEESEEELITGSADCTAILWSVATAIVKQHFIGHTGAIGCMTITKDGSILFTGSTDWTIRMWKKTTGQLLTTFEEHQGQVLCMQLVGEFLYSGDSSGEAHSRLWKKGELIRKYKGHQHSVVAFKFYRRMLYTVSGDSCGRAFDAASGELRYLFRGHTRGLTGLQLVRNHLFTISSDGTVRRWKLAKPTKDELLEQDADSEDDLGDGSSDEENDRNGY